MYVLANLPTGGGSPDLCVAEIKERRGWVLWSVLLIKELSKLGNCKQTFTVRYHPMGSSYE